MQVVLPSGSISYTPEQQEAYRERKEREKAKKIQRGCNDALGYFYFANQQEPFKCISPESVTRLIYLNTFVGYDNKLMLSERKPMTRADLPSVLHLSTSTVIRFLREVSPAYIVEKEDGLIFANRDIFIKGAIPKSADRYQKIYIDGVRRLYNSVPRQNDRQLGYLFKLLPYINIEYNLICRNPFETDIDKIELISLAEFCALVGYDVAHINKLLKIYNSLLFDVGGRMERFCAIAYDGVHKSGAKIFVNPHILYSGSDYQKVEVLGVFCTD